MNKPLAIAIFSLSCGACANQELYDNIFADQAVPTPERLDASTSVEMDKILWSETFPTNRPATERPGEFDQSFFSLSGIAPMYWIFADLPSACGPGLAMKLTSIDQLKRSQHLSLYYIIPNTIPTSSASAVAIFKNSQTEITQAAILRIQYYVPLAVTGGLNIKVSLVDENLQNIAGSTKTLAFTQSVPRSDEDLTSAMLSFSNFGTNRRGSVIRGVRLEYRPEPTSMKDETSCLRISKMQLCSAKSEAGCPW